MNVPTRASMKRSLCLLTLAIGLSSVPSAAQVCTGDCNRDGQVAINEVMADWETPVGDGDVVLLFPPVAGG